MEPTGRLPDCAIKGHHSRDAHKTYCRPAIDAAWAARPRPPRRLVVSEPRPPMAHPITDDYGPGMVERYDRVGNVVAGILAALLVLGIIAALVRP
jgi:hypothetical protein